MVSNYFLSVGHVSAAQEIALEELPQAIVEHFKVYYIGAELKQAWKEGGEKEYYIIRFTHHGRLQEVYVTPDVSILMSKESELLLTNLSTYADGTILLLIVPGILAGASIRWRIQVRNKYQMSVLAEWTSAWIGAALFLGFIVLLVLQIFPGSRNRDYLLIAILCLLVSVLSASVVECSSLILQSFRGSRLNCRRWILFFGFVVLLSHCLIIAAGMWRSERVNQQHRELLMRRTMR